MNEYAGGLAERIVQEGKLVSHLVHAEEALSEEEQDRLREIVIDHVVRLFHDRVDITHCDRAVNGAKLYLEPPEQLGQVRAEIIDLPFIEKAQVSQSCNNCLILLFRTPPRLGCSNYLKACVVLATIAAFLIYILSIVNPRSLPALWPSGDL